MFDEIEQKFENLITAYTAEFAARDMPKPQVLNDAAQALTDLRAWREKIPDLKAGLEHLEKYNEIHRCHEEAFEIAAALLSQANERKCDE